MASKSLSSRRAWIEMSNWRNLWIPSRRSPHGERGLKSDVDYGNAASNMSLSSRRAWIEIPSWCQAPQPVWSLSSRRAWIEIALR